MGTVNLARRAALVAPTAAAQLERAFGPTNPWRAAGLMGPPANSVEPAWAVPDSLLLKAARHLYRAKDRERDRHTNYRAGRFDHDVHVMGSWSLAFKATVQRERDEAEEGVLEKLRRAAYPDLGDY